jgi:peptidoglycan/xylan/chitin deacetylase (PgdA/CDA1 family)
MASDLRGESLTLRWVAKYLVATLVYYSGLLSVFRFLRRQCGKGRILILAYHAISDFPNYLDMFMGVSKFSSQIRYLKTHYQVIGIDEAVNLIASQTLFHEDKIVITFDDGYQDNFENGYPLLREHGLPAAIFLATQSLDSGLPTFVFSVALILEHTSRDVLDLREYGLKQYRLDDRRSKEETLFAIDDYCRKLKDSEKTEFCHVLVEKLGPFSAGMNILEGRMLPWNKVKEMSDNGITFGAHTATHPFLSNLTAEEMEKEIAHSKRTIEEMIGKPVLFFAYPYGGRESINTAAVKVVKESGFKAAFVLFRNKMARDNMFVLGRVMVSNGMTSNPINGFSRAMFACEVSGLFDVMFRRT